MSIVNIEPGEAALDTDSGVSSGSMGVLARRCKRFLEHGRHKSYQKSIEWEVNYVESLVFVLITDYNRLQNLEVINYTVILVQSDYRKTVIDS